MKRITLLSSIVSIAFALNAQSVDDGIQQMYYQRYQSAENTFHQVLQQDPNNATAWYYLEKDYLLENKLDKASDSIQLAPTNVKDDPWYKVAYGTVLLQQGKKDEATNYFNDAIKDTKEKDAGILSSVADANINAKPGDVNYAIDLLNKAIKRDKKNAALYVMLGDAYLKTSNGSEAFKAYQKATEINDKYAQAYHKLGEIFVSQKNPEMYLSYFQKAIAADPNYAPSLYRLYVYEFNRNPAKAMEYYNQYMVKSDTSIENEYDLADLYFINKQYNNAIQKADAIVKAERDKVQPRLYKLISYSYAEQKDSAKAFDYMQTYFAKAADSNTVAKDYLLMGDLYASVKQDDSLAFTYYDKAVALEKDSSQLVKYFKRFADLAAADKNYTQQAKWLGKYYLASGSATNIDLFNWGLAHYRAEEYTDADSAFGIYVAKYPDQSFGYYWQAKSKALADKDMTQGLAVPAYEKLIEVLEKNPNDANYKNWLVEAYAYLAAYQTNNQKNYAEAVNYFEKVLQVDPENANAKKYITVLQKSLDDKGSK
ncbi:MAG TPA: tetratricopeptide repeat protein [Flavisolibacter sp.]|jgi:tetratricopeptide (TPR) repeat protein|nr:tetratricopeptide repeat protein [Flavisolibacter sp.]